MKTIIIILLSVAVVFLAATSIALLQAANTSAQVAAQRQDHINTLLYLTAKLESASDICMDLMERSIIRRNQVLQEFHGDGRDDQVRSGPGRAHKRSPGRRGARYAAFP